MRAEQELTNMDIAFDVSGMKTLEQRLSAAEGLLSSHQAAGVDANHRQAPQGKLTVFDRAARNLENILEGGAPAIRSELMRLTVDNGASTRSPEFKKSSGGQSARADEISHGSRPPQLPISSLDAQIKTAMRSAASESDPRKKAVLFAEASRLIQMNAGADDRLTPNQLRALQESAAKEEDPMKRAQIHARARRGRQ